MSTAVRQENGRAYDKNPELIARYRAGDKDAGEEIVVLNRPLVCSIASRFIGRGVDIEDLVATGNIGLVKAINTFDFSRECAFSTYAVPLIFGEIRRFLRDDGIIKVSREEKKLAAIVAAERERRQAAGESLAISAIAAAVGVSPAEAASALSAGAPVRSLDESAYSDDDSVSLGSIIFDEYEEERQLDKLSLGYAIERLSEWQRRLIVLRYYRDYSQTETAAVLGVTQVKISREEKKILKILREQLS
ncbi:MAG: sigma-70 family RNA polymerase sigma factor [Ruminococcaceae bacterium]|nr:sigma-70 family RNA polymerase sigma factor [Oscillospiraceae bacterium]